MSVWHTYLPGQSVYDPAEASEGSIDPLGLALAAGRLAEVLVPGFTERTRRPRFLVALALGAHLLDRQVGGSYSDHPEGPAYLAFERLLLESFAHAGDRDDPGLLRVPGIQKARDAHEAGARLVSALYLKNPAAVGLWIAYKALAVATQVIDEDGHLLENGHDLLVAWEQGTGSPGRVTGPRDTTTSFFSEMGAALAPLLGEAGSPGKPRKTWEHLHEGLHPSRASGPEKLVLRRLVRDLDDRRRAVFERIEASWGHGEEILGIDEATVLTGLAEADEPLGDRAKTIRAYEVLAGQVTSAFRCLLYVGGRRGDGRVDVGAVLADGDVGPSFKAAPRRIRTALERLRPRLAESEIAALPESKFPWLESGALESPESLLAALVARHLATQMKKPPDGKRPWFEVDGASLSVRANYVAEQPPPPEGLLHVHPYRTTAVRSSIVDLLDRRR